MNEKHSGASELDIRLNELTQIIRRVGVLARDVADNQTLLNELHRVQDMLQQRQDELISKS